MKFRLRANGTLFRSRPKAGSKWKNGSPDPFGPELEFRDSMIVISFAVPELEFRQLEFG